MIRVGLNGVLLPAALVAGLSSGTALYLEWTALEATGRAQPPPGWAIALPDTRTPLDLPEWWLGVPPDIAPPEPVAPTVQPRSVVVAGSGTGAEGAGVGSKIAVGADQGRVRINYTRTGATVRPTAHPVVRPDPGPHPEPAPHPEPGPVPVPGPDPDPTPGPTSHHPCRPRHQPPDPAGRKAHHLRTEVTPGQRPIADDDQGPTVDSRVRRPPAERVRRIGTNVALSTKNVENRGGGPLFGTSVGR
jgi:hypothetical protein